MISRLSYSIIILTFYIFQNAVRIARALFEVVLRKSNPIMAGRFLMMSKMFELQLWDFQSPMRQFHIIGADLQEKLEERKLTVEKLRDMDSKEIGEIYCLFSIASKNFFFCVVHCVFYYYRYFPTSF